MKPTKQGHVDTTASITSKQPDGDSIRYTFALANPSQMPYIIEKGYVTVDGASLTVTQVDEEKSEFGIMLISHSQSVLTLTHKEVGAMACAVASRSKWYATLRPGWGYGQYRSRRSRQVCAWFDIATGGNGGPYSREAPQGAWQVMQMIVIRSRISFD